MKIITGGLKYVSLIAIFAINSCAVGPKYNKPNIEDKIPKKYFEEIKTQKVALVTDNWWETFKDPVLNQLVES
jgi:outer membrane protein TolC